MPSIMMEEKHFQIVKSILNKYNIKAYAFGSRLKRTAKEFSDLDLLIKQPVDPIKMRQLKDDFEESTIPYKVDVILWEKIDENFKNMIEHDLFPFAELKPTTLP